MKSIMPFLEGMAFAACTILIISAGIEKNLDWWFIIMLEATCLMWIFISILNRKRAERAERLIEYLEEFRLYGSVTGRLSSKSNVKSIEVSN